MQPASASGQRELELRYHRPAGDSGEGPPAEALAPLERDGGENPYDIQHDLGSKSPTRSAIAKRGQLRVGGRLVVRGQLTGAGGLWATAIVTRRSSRRTN
jgi:hypothetical protein